MTIQKIQTGSNNPVLQQKAAPIKQITLQIKGLILDMIETMEVNNGIGLAAPQLGQIVRIIVAKPELNKQVLILINPQIKKFSLKKETIEESCLSLPNISAPVERPIKITLKGLDINGQSIKIKAKGLLARIIQHEIDHLDGILITDRGTVPKFLGTVPLSVLFIGTSQFALPALKQLKKNNYNIIKNITKPIVLEPKEISKLAPDLIIVATYGRIIPKNILALPRLGCLNIHPSLLPKYRGPSPIQTAILNNDKTTGITIILMDEKIDHGPIIAQKKIPIKREENYQTLEKKLSEAAADFLIKILPQYIQGQIKPQPQNHVKAIYTKILTRQDGKIDWNKSAQEIERKIRAFYPWPGAWTYFNRQRVKILKAKAIDKKNKTTVQTQKGYLLLKIVQPAGKKPMTGEEFFRGHKQI